ncbi:hypothetical protein [Streptomyces alkaliphilus]|uniref:Uncharacterized protein n=1 Tax=Streptomyces alkaliphilus TaxID=1472722 RepID=A0A7W3TEC6_9ACTN|nr:hypothetical protein [Streptomyces alkaliphilus]MBB0245298.1 hypothetical protein [Streptomyces alkaliphilus]MQS08651.1 hypothetical protein [Streptomyces alkaliphilus]
MNLTGTIGRPAPHGPEQSTHMNEHFRGGRRLIDAAEPRPAPNRNREMELLPEAMARSQLSERLREAESQRRAHQLALSIRMERRSRRLHRRAERASHRARRALARALM